MSTIKIIIAVALGHAEFSRIKDYGGQIDLFGRPFKFSKVNVADSLATAAALCMGEGDESQPLAMISGAPIKYYNPVDRGELIIDSELDMYKPLMVGLNNLINR
jgi:F420-0:gamma-glutamyl ligase